MSFLTTEELADRWGLHPGTIRNWRHEGRGPEWRKINKNPLGPVIYDMKTVLDYEKKNKMNHGKNRKNK